MSDTVVTGKTERPKVVSTTDGAQVIKGGQRLEDPIGTAIMSSYSNLVYSPLIVALYVLAIACTCASIFSVEGPLEFAVDEIQKTYNTTKAPIIKALAGSSYRICKWLLAYKDTAITVALLWLPYAKKPSSKNFNVTILFTVLAFLFSGVGLLELFMLSQCWFLYTELRNPRHKLFVGGFVGLLIIFQYLAEPVVGQITNRPAKVFRYHWNSTAAPSYTYKWDPPTSMRSYTYKWGDSTLKSYTYKWDTTLRPSTPTPEPAGFKFSLLPSGDAVLKAHGSGDQTFTRRTPLATTTTARPQTPMATHRSTTKPAPGRSSSLTSTTARPATTNRRKALSQSQITPRV